MGKNDIEAGIRLTGEGEFKSAVTNVNKSLNAMKSEMALVRAEYAGQENTLEALTKKQEILNKVLEEQKRKVTATKAGLDHATETYNSIGKSVEKLWVNLEKEKNKLEEIEKIYGSSSKEALEQNKVIASLNAEIEIGEKNWDKAGDRIKDWETKLNTAKAQVLKANSELNKNAAYMKEAEEATDQCATSIDKFGKEIAKVDAATDTFADGLFANLASSGIEKGLEIVEQAAEKVKESMYDISGASAKLQASTGATTTAMNKYNAVMKAIKGNNFGESYSDVAEAMEVVIQTMGELDSVELQNVTENAMTLQDTFGYDYQEQLRTVDMLMQQFGITSTEAYNLIVQGTQQGLNKNGDLLDTINEYSVHYAQMGVSAEGFFNSLANGTEAGTFSVDKLGDAYKEFGIRVKDTATTTDEAYELLGLNADKMRKMFADGGESAEKATDIVLDALMNMDDKVKQNQAGVDLFGTMWENLGIASVQALTNLEGEISSTKSVMESLKDVRYSDLESAVSGLGAAIEENITTPIAEAALPAVTELFEKATEIVEGIGESISPQKTELQSFVDTIKASNDEVQKVLDNAQATIDGATADTATIEAYKKTLLELNTQESLTEFQKYQLATAVQTLGNSVPGLTDAFDTEKGILTATNEELVEMFDNAQALAMQSALLEAQADSYEALAEATINMAKADSAVSQATEDLNELEKSMTDAVMTGQLSRDQQIAYSDSLDATQKALSAAEKEQERANEAYKAAEEQVAFETEALKGLQEQYGLTAESAAETTESIETVTDAKEEEARIFDEYGNDITEMSEEEAEAVAEASQKIIDAYDDMQQGIRDSIKGSMDLFNEFSGGAEITAEQMNTNLESQITGIEKWSENMETLAGQIGQGFSQELYDELAAMGPKQSATAVQALVDALNSESGEFEEVSDNWAKLLSLQDNAESIASATAAGKKLVGGLVTGIEEESEQVAATTQAMTQSAVESIERETSNFQSAGNSAAQAYLDALNAAKTQAAQAGGALGSVAYNAAAAWQNAFYSVGYNISSGIAEGVNAGSPLVETAVRKVVQNAKIAANDEADSHSPSRVFQNQVGKYMSSGIAVGILDGQKDVMAASRNTAKAALEAAKKELDIHSPSGKFKDDVGKQVGKGFAFGIKDSASLAGKEARKMSSKVYTEATAWLKKYKKSQKVSVDNEKYYWKQVLRHTKEGTAAYAKALKKLTAAEMKDDFGVSWYTTQNKKKVKKDAETYYSEVYQAAQTYYEKITVKDDMSLNQQKKYWTQVRNTLKKGTQAWRDAQAQIDAIKAKIGTVSNAASVLSAYQTYYDMSEQAVVNYWDTVRKKYEAGTDERLEADQKYFEAKEALNDKLVELEEDYADKVSEIDTQLNDEIAKLNEDYEDQLKSRAEAIKNAFGLFDEFESESADGKTLLFNIKSQAAGYEDWMEQLDALESKGILDESLLEELKEQGPEISASIHALNSLTSEELAEYNEAYLKKLELSNKQAEEDTEDLKQSIAEQTATLKAQAEAEKAELLTAYEQSVSKVTAGMSSSLQTLADNVKLIAEDQTTALVAAIKGEAGLKDGAAASTGSNVSNSTKADVSVTSDGLPSSSASTSSSTGSSDKILAIINSYPKRETLSSKELKEHSDLFQYIYKNYKRKPGNAMYKELADALGVTADKTPTAKQRSAILKKLKAKGYRSGGRNLLEELIWMDEDLDTVGPELLVRKSDNAILTRINPGDDVVNAETVANMAKWAQYKPESAQEALLKIQEQIAKQQATLRSYAESLNLSGITKLNALLAHDTSSPASSASGDISRLETLVSSMIDIMKEFLPNLSYLEERQQIVLDSGAVVGGTVSKMSNELAMRNRRRR